MSKPEFDPNKPGQESMFDFLSEDGQGLPVPRKPVYKRSRKSMPVIRKPVPVSKSGPLKAPKPGDPIAPPPSLTVPVETSSSGKFNNSLDFLDETQAQPSPKGAVQETVPKPSQARVKRVASPQRSASTDNIRRLRQSDESAEEDLDLTREFKSFGRKKSTTEFKFDSDWREGLTRHAPEREGSRDRIIRWGSWSTALLLLLTGGYYLFSKGQFDALQSVKSDAVSNRDSAVPVVDSVTNNNASIESIEARDATSTDQSQLSVQETPLNSRSDEDEKSEVLQQSTLASRFQAQLATIEALVQNGALDEAQNALSGLDRSVYGYGAVEFQALEQTIAQQRSATSDAVGSTELEPSKGQLAELRRAEAEQTQAARDRAIAERVAAERAQIERAAADRAEAERERLERAAAERAAAERAVAERVAAERELVERAAAERLAAERAVAERAVAERVAAEQAVVERAAAERAAAERAEAQRAEQRLAEQRLLIQERREQQRLANERLAAINLEADRRTQQRAAEEAARKIRAEQAAAATARLARDAGIAQANRSLQSSETQNNSTRNQNGDASAAAERAEKIRLDALEEAAREEARRQIVEADRIATAQRIAQERAAVERQAAREERLRRAQEIEAARAVRAASAAETVARLDNRESLVSQSDPVSTSSAVVPVPGSAATVRPISDAELQTVYQRFSDLKDAISQRDISKVVNLTKRSGLRVQQFMQVFENSSNIDVGIRNVSTSNATSEISGILQINSIQRNDGTVSEAPANLKSIRMTTRREGSDWSAISW